MERVTTYFKISPDADMAYDVETNEPVACYAQVSTDHEKKLTDEDIQSIHDAHLSMFADQTDIEERLIRKISKDEYDANMDEGDTP